MTTTRPIGEEEPYETTHAIGEEDYATTDALGEESPYDEPASTVNPFGDF
jgi:hypothetical protein